MKHRTDTFEKLSRALQLHEQGVPSFAIGERLGISSKAAARTILQAKERRAKRLIVTTLPSTERRPMCDCGHPLGLCPECKQSLPSTEGRK